MWLSIGPGCVCSATPLAGLILLCFSLRVIIRMPDVSGPRASASGYRPLALRRSSLDMKLHAHTMACCPMQTGWCFCSIMQLVTNVSILCALSRITPQSLNAEGHLLGRRLRQTHCRRITQQPMRGLRIPTAPPSRCSTP